MKELARRLLVSYLGKLRYSIVRNEYLEIKAFSHHLKELFKELDITVVLDVGANTGGYRDFLRNNVEFKGLILSFEPVSTCYSILREAAKKDPKWEVFNYALGSEDIWCNINIMKSLEMCSFLEPDSSSIPEISQANKVIGTEKVWIRRLDSIWPELQKKYSLESVYLKLDTQGYDIEVVKGAINSLKEIRAMQMEMYFLQIYKDQPDFSKAYRVLNSIGYHITGIFPINRDKSRRIIDVDCILKNCGRSQ